MSKAQSEVDSRRLVGEDVAVVLIMPFAYAYRHDESENVNYTRNGEVHGVGALHGDVAFEVDRHNWR